MFMQVVNTIVAGTLGALVAHTVGFGPAATAGVGALVGLVHLGAALAYGRRTFSDPPIAPRFPSPPG